MIDGIAFCRALAKLSESADGTTRTFLSAPMHAVHRELRIAMERLGMEVRVDAVGNLRGFYAGLAGKRLVIGSHVDTVPDAGAFDGVLGVVLGIALIDHLGGRRLPFGIEIVAFSEEEGVRFGVPFIGARALVGTVDDSLLAKTDGSGVSVAEAIRTFGLDPANMADALLDEGVFAYLEFHIEQGPVLESMAFPLGVVEAIVGQSRLEVIFHGKANHAGTTPMNLRKDALAGAAEWISAVERQACYTPGLVATVGKLSVAPGAGNVIPSEVRASLDVRHASDTERRRSVERILDDARQIAVRRGLAVDVEERLNQPAVPCDRELTDMLANAVAAAGFPVHRMPGGAGHDAMIVAARLPVAMLFLRSPGGISHHPDEAVLPGDVEAALQAGLRFIGELENRYA